MEDLKNMKDYQLKSLWGYKLKELVEGICMPQHMYNSLPFVIQKDNEYQIRWFYYELKQVKEKCYLYVRHIVTLDNSGRFAITLNPLVSTEWNLQTSSRPVPTLDFYDTFVEHFKEGQYQKILDLLIEFESTDSIALYDELSHLYV